MSNPSRKLVTVRRIDRIEPHPNADRLELAHIGGWQCVVGKGEFSEGQFVLYFEPDSFLALDDSRFAFLRERGVKTMSINHEEVEGHVLRTIKLRGEYSQGLVLDAVGTLGTSEETVAELCAGKVNMSKALGVVEYYKPMPLGAKDFIGRYDSRFAPRTDAERIQNIDQETWDMVKQTCYEVSVKVDGTSITIGKPSEDEELAIFSHNNRYGLDRGMGKLVLDVATKQGLVDFCEANPGITLQCELCGPKIQADRLRLGQHRLFVFSVYDMDVRCYLESNELDGMEHLDGVLESYVPIVSTGTLLDEFETPSDFLAYVDGMRDHVTKGCLDEGLVVHIYGKDTLDEDSWMRLRLTLGDQLQVKAVSNKYLLKARE